MNLSSRFSHYFSLHYLAKKTSKYNSKTYNALLAYAYENFQVETLDVCTRSDLIKKKQFYIDYSFSSSSSDEEKEEDNILTKAGSSTNILNKHY